MKVTAIKVNSNGGMGGGSITLYTKQSMNQVLEGLNSSKFIVIDDIVENYGMKKRAINPAWVSYIGETHIVMDTLKKWYYGSSDAEAAVNAKMCNNRYRLD